MRGIVNDRAQLVALQLHGARQSLKVIVAMLGGATVLMLTGLLAVWVGWVAIVIYLRCGMPLAMTLAALLNVVLARFALWHAITLLPAPAAFPATMRRMTHALVSEAPAAVHEGASMKPSLQDEIDAAERSVVQRDIRILQRLAVATQLARQATTRGRWVIGTAAACLGGWVLARVLRGRQAPTRAASSKVVPHTARSIFWAAVPWLLPMVLPGRPATARQPPWLGVGRRAASFMGRVMSQHQHDPRR